MSTQNMHPQLEPLIRNIERVIYGKRSVLEMVVCALLARGHVLIEDIPGVGKTLLVNALARSLGLTFGRIQCTPDVMPSDITGFNLYNMNTGKMEFRQGMIMHNLVLADEINRAAPKTQSSLLEVMEEYQVSVDGVTYPVPQPFMVLATQNPIEYIGTSPLPEAQMDRFIMRLSLGYPGFDDEIMILDRHGAGTPINELHPIMDGAQLIALQNQASEIFVHPDMKKYITAIVFTTRRHKEVALGASPRATLNLMKISQAYALLHNRKFITPEDVQEVAHFVISHRLILKSETRLKGTTAQHIVQDVLGSVNPPAGIG